MNTTSNMITYPSSNVEQYIPQKGLFGTDGNQDKQRLVEHEHGLRVQCTARERIQEYSCSKANETHEVKINAVLVEREQGIDVDLNLSNTMIVGAALAVLGLGGCYLYSKNA